MTSTHLTKILPAALAALFIGPSARALIEETYTLDTIAYDFESGFDYGYAEARATTSGGAQSVNWDFGAAGSETLRIVWQAPAGSVFQLRFPEGEEWNGDAIFELTLASLTSSGVTSYSFDGTASLTFTTSSSTVFPAVQMSVALADSTGDDLLSFSGNSTGFTKGVTYEFTSMVLETTVPESFAGTIVKNNLAVALGVSSDGFVASGATYANPNPILQIAAIPEPASAAWMGLGVAAFGLARRRRRSASSGAV